MSADRSGHDRVHRNKKQRTLTVGVTGGIASGKTTVTNFLAEKGICIVDADVAARIVVEPGKPALAKIVQRYGENILSHNSLNRKQLKNIIMDDPVERNWLEHLLHPLIYDQVVSELSAARSSYVVLVSPLMMESNHHELVDRVLVIDVPEDLQIARTIARDRITHEQAEKIIDSQIDRKLRVARADDVVDNSGSRVQLHLAMEKLHQFYLQLVETLN